MTKFTTALLTGSALLLFTACGGGGSSDAGSGDTGSTSKDMVSITDENADDVISASVQSVSGITDIGDIMLGDGSANIAKSTSHLNKLGNIASAKLEPGTLAESGTESCSEGGSVSYDGNENTGGTVTFNECAEYGVTIDGTMVLAINGADTTTDFINFSIKTSYDEVFYSSATMDLNTNTYDMSVTATGYAVDDGSRYDFENYSLEKIGNSYTFAGFVKTDCMGGWIEIKTNQALVIGYDCPTAGDIVAIGDGSELRMVFNSDMSVDVSINGEYYEDYDSCDDLPEGVCK